MKLYILVTFNHVGRSLYQNFNDILNIQITNLMGPVLDMAVAAVLLTLPTAYLFVAGVIVPVVLHATLPPAAPVSRAAFWQSVVLGFTLLLLFVAVPLAAFLFLTAGSA